MIRIHPVSFMLACGVLTILTFTACVARADGKSQAIPDPCIIGDTVCHSPRPEPRPARYWCDAHSKWTTKEHARSSDCRNHDDRPERDEPPVECTRNQHWTPGTMIVRGYEKQCA